MSEHLPECWAKHASDPPAWCICDELRACADRVTAAAVQRVEALPPHHGSYAGWLMADEAIAAIKNEVK